MQLIYRDPYYSGMLAQNATLAVKFAQAKRLGLVKPTLIDSEARWGDEAQAKAA